MSSFCVFGGAFDPPHLGHTDVIQALRARGHSILVVPDAQSLLKNNIATQEQRSTMARLAFQGSEILENTAAPSSYETISRLKSLYPNLVFAVGSDQLEILPKWQRYPEILGLCPWLFWVRRPHPRAEVEGHFQRVIPERYRKSIEIVEVEARELSSALIREKLGRAEPSMDFIEHALHPKVWTYIKELRLYGT